MTVTQKINALLAERGIDKKTFYRDCTISSASYSQWATGKNKPRPERLEQIAEYLGVSVDELTGEEKTAPVNEDSLSVSQRQLLQLLPLLTDQESFVLLSNAQTLIASRTLRDSE